MPGATNQTYTPTVTGNYKVEVTLSSGTVTSACASVTTLVNSSFDISSTLKIYPNPATSNINIDFQDLENASVEFSDINGRVLITQKLNNTLNNVNIEKLTSGMYLFKVSSSQGAATSKIIKK